MRLKIKIVISFIFVFFVLNCSTGGTREEIVERYGDKYAGVKKLVLTKSGKGGSDQVIKKTFFYENGNKWKEENFENGKKTGNFTEWYENGIKKLEENLDNKTIVKYDLKSHLIYTKKVIKNQRDLIIYETKKKYYNNGSQKYSKNFVTKNNIIKRSGIWIAWDEKGNIKNEIDYQGANLEISKHFIQEISALIGFYIEINRKLPPTDKIKNLKKYINEFKNKTLFEEEFISKDRWGKNLQYHRFKNQSHYYILSYGPDSIPYSKDDIYWSSESGGFTIEPININYNSNLFEAIIEKHKGNYKDLLHWKNRVIGIKSDIHKKLFYRNVELPFYKIIDTEIKALVAYNLKERSDSRGWTGRSFVLKKDGRIYERGFSIYSDSYRGSVLISFDGSQFMNTSETPPPHLLENIEDEGFEILKQKAISGSAPKLEIKNILNSYFELVENLSFKISPVNFNTPNELENILKPYKVKFHKIQTEYKIYRYQNPTFSNKSDGFLTALKELFNKYKYSMANTFSKIVKIESLGYEYQKCKMKIKEILEPWNNKFVFKNPPIKDSKLESTSESPISLGISGKYKGKFLSAKNPQGKSYDVSAFNTFTILYMKISREGENVYASMWHKSINQPYKRRSNKTDKNVIINIKDAKIIDNIFTGYSISKNVRTNISLVISKNGEILKGSLKSSEGTELVIELYRVK